MTPADENAIRELDRELTSHPPLCLDVEAPAAFALASVVIVGLRHHGIAPNIRTAAEQFVHVVRAHFTGAPVVLEQLAKRADPAFDV